MTYSTVMVHLDLDQSNDARLQVAGDLAEQFNSKLIGIACCQPQPTVYADGAFAQSLVKQLEAEADEKLKKLEQRFRTAFQNRIKDIEWRRAFAVPVEYVAHEARAADLVITGADRVGGLADPLWRLDPSELVMKLGRPMMVVPPEVDRLKLSERGRRLEGHARSPPCRGRRAAAVAKGEGSDRGRDHRERRGSSRLPATGSPTSPLGSAGIRWMPATWCRTCGAMPSSSSIRHASDIEADMIVAGAYGHTRMREWIFGGVTRDLITQSRRCSLLSH